MFSSVISAAIYGMEGQKIIVEADVSDGLPMFSMVGYLASEVREAQDRVRTALKNTGIHLPAKRVTVNLAPADLHKAGSGFDLAILVAVLAAAGDIPEVSVKGILFLGELSLNGEINGIRGALEMVGRAKQFGCHTCILPLQNLTEGSVIREVRVLGAEHIHQVIAFLKGEGELKETHINIEEMRQNQGKTKDADFCEIQGQSVLKRAAEVAVSGMHNLLIIGPPGSGKTMTAQRIPGILPETSLEEALEITKIHSIAGTLSPEEGLMLRRPFRAPHHTITPTAMAGGGMRLRPGEVTLAHRGVLYLDELPEFDRDTLEILRQPLEDGTVCISRHTGSYRFLADFMLVASMNPCKCGYYPDMNRCTCTAGEVRRYLKRISRPLLDRIDIVTDASPIQYGELTGTRPEESSAQIRERVIRAQQIQQNRYRGEKIRFNSELSAVGVKKYCCLGKEESDLMKDIYERLELTARSYNRILKVARTIADLEGSETITAQHLGEAVCYRSLDKKYWGA